MRKWAIPTMLATMLTIALALTGCGRKEPPVPMAPSAPPAIASMTHEVSANSLKLVLVLSGGSGGVGYQIDRAPIDPYCHCPGFWRRYRASPARPELEGVKTTVLINLRGGDLAYAFRVRAVDALGRLGPWSKVIRVRSQLKSLE